MAPSDAKLFQFPIPALAAPEKVSPKTSEPKPLSGPPKRRTRKEQPLTIYELAEKRFGKRAPRRVLRRIEAATQIVHRDIYRRLHYFPTLSSALSGEPLSCLQAISLERLIEHAIGDPLRKWGLRLYHNPFHDDLKDTEHILYSADWLLDAPECRNTVIHELMTYGAALVVCSRKEVARALSSYQSTRPGRVWTHLIDPKGRRPYAQNLSRL
jgi:hypothetical protein